MEKIDPTEIEPYEFNESERRALSTPLGTSDLAINQYQIEPGEGLPGGLHTHMDQEEVYVVLQGEAAFETLAGEVTVSAGEVIRFAPGEFQSGKNDGNERLTVLALGAPPGTNDTRLPVPCPDCEHETLRFELDGEQPTFKCPNCDITYPPASCPDCGHDELRATLLDESECARIETPHVLEDSDVPIGVVCQSCEAVFERPPRRK